MKYSTTASRLKQALADNNMTARELSVKSGVSEASISQYINGTHKPGNISSGKIAEVLNCNPVWLMGFDGVPKEAESSVYYESDYIVTENPSSPYAITINQKKRNEFLHRNLPEITIEQKKDDNSNQMNERALFYSQLLNRINKDENYYEFLKNTIKANNDELNILGDLLRQLKD